MARIISLSCLRDPTREKKKETENSSESHVSVDNDIITKPPFRHPDITVIKKALLLLTVIKPELIVTRNYGGVSPLDGEYVNENCTRASRKTRSCGGQT